jgi:pyruvate kinase
MAIRRKDRSFEEILKDVVMEEVPIEYITHIQLKLNNGDVLEFSQDDLVGMKDAKEVLRAQGMEHLKDSVADIEVFIDSAKIKGRVIQYVRGLFNSQFGEEK